MGDTLGHTSVLSGTEAGRELRAGFATDSPAMEFTLLEFGIVGGEGGCEVHVVGDHPALGCWSPAQSVPLHPGGTLEGLPFWKTRTPISIPSGTTIQYKYLLMKDGLLHRWEKFEGNRESADVQGPSTAAGLTRLPAVTAVPPRARPVSLRPGRTTIRPGVPCRPLRSLRSLCCAPASEPHYSSVRRSSSLTVTVTQPQPTPAVSARQACA